VSFGEISHSSTNQYFIILLRLTRISKFDSIQDFRKKLSVFRESNSGSAAGRIKTHTIPIQHVPILALISHFNTSKEKSMETFG
jgi:hypothetical protein